MLVTTNKIIDTRNFQVCSSTRECPLLCIKHSNSCDCNPILCGKFILVLPIHRCVLALYTQYFPELLVLEVQTVIVKRGVVTARCSYGDGTLTLDLSMCV